MIINSFRGNCKFGKKKYEKSNIASHAKYKEGYINWEKKTEGG